jgi:hypothetical protein
MLKRILLLLGETAASEAARQYAFDLARRRNAEIAGLAGIDLTSIEVPMPGVAGGAAYKGKLEAAMKQEASDASHACTIFTRTRASVTGYHSTGFPSKAIQLPRSIWRQNRATSLFPDMTRRSAVLLPRVYLMFLRNCCGYRRVLLLFYRKKDRPITMCWSPTTAACRPCGRCNCLCCSVWDTDSTSMSRLSIQVRKWQQGGRQVLLLTSGATA